MSQSPLKKLWVAVLHQYHKPESLLIVCCAFSVIMLGWLLFVHPDAGSNPLHLSGSTTAAAVTTNVEDPIYTGALVRQITPSATVSPDETVVEPRAETIYIAIILDDIGNNEALGMRDCTLGLSDYFCEGR